jgi:hypothetical protein
VVSQGGRSFAYRLWKDPDAEAFLFEQFQETPTGFIATCAVGYLSTLYIAGFYESIYDGVGMGAVYYADESSAGPLFDLGEVPENTVEPISLDNDNRIYAITAAGKNLYVLTNRACFRWDIDDGGYSHVFVGAGAGYSAPYIIWNPGSDYSWTAGSLDGAYRLPSHWEIDYTGDGTPSGNTAWLGYAYRHPTNFGPIEYLGATKSGGSASLPIFDTWGEASCYADLQMKSFEVKALANGYAFEIIIQGTPGVSRFAILWGVLRYESIISQSPEPGVGGVLMGYRQGSFIYVLHKPFENYLGNIISHYAIQIGDWRNVPLGEDPEERLYGGSGDLVTLRGEFRGGMKLWINGIRVTTANLDTYDPAAYRSPFLPAFVAHSMLFSGVPIAQNDPLYGERGFWLNHFYGTQNPVVPPPVEPDTAEDLTRNNVYGLLYGVTLNNVPASPAGYMSDIYFHPSLAYSKGALVSPYLTMDSTPVVGWSETGRHYCPYGYLTQSVTNFHTGTIPKDYRYISVAHNELPTGSTITMAWEIDGKPGSIAGVAMPSGRETRFYVNDQGYSIRTTLGMTCSTDGTQTPIVNCIHVVWNFFKNRVHTYLLDCRAGAGAGQWEAPTRNAQDPKEAIQFLFEASSERCIFEDKYAGSYTGAIETLEFQQAKPSLHEGESGLVKLMVREEEYYVAAVP